MQQYVKVMGVLCPVIRKRLDRFGRTEYMVWSCKQIVYHVE